LLWFTCLRKYIRIAVVYVLTQVHKDCCGLHAGIRIAVVYVLTQVHKDSGIRKLARTPLVLEVLKFSNKEVIYVSYG